MNARLFFFFLFLLSVSRAFSQSFGYLGIEHGLSNNTVNAIYKDRIGFIWFATDDGLNQYNGYQFKVYRNRIDDTTSLIHNQLITLNGDSLGNIWVGTKKGLCVLNSNTSGFSLAYYYPLQAAGRKKIVNDINEIEIDKEQQVFVGTDNSGLLVSNTDHRNFRQVALHSEPKNASYSVRALHIDADGKVWVMVQHAGLHRYNPETKQLHLVDNVIDKANVIKAANRNGLWIGTDKGLYLYNHRTKTYTHYGKGTGKLSSSRVVDINTSEENRLWVATDGGGVNVLDLTTGKITAIQTGTGKTHLTSNAVTSLLKDEESRWWIGLQRGGINVLDKKKDKFTTIRQDLLSKNPLVDNFTLSFCEDADNAVWIGTDGGGVSLWNRTDNTFRNFVHNENDPTSLSSNYATSIVRDYADNIWIATWDGGINRYNRATGTFTHYTCGPHKYVWRLYEDSQKTLWAGLTEDGPLYRYNRAADAFELFDPKLVQPITILEDWAKTLWIGTYNELVKVDKKDKKHKRYTLNYPVRALYQDKRGNLWVGSQGHGLLHFDPVSEKFTSYTETEGLANNSVHTIEEDSHGKLWISTYHGISSFDPQTKEFDNYYEADGLQSNQFNYNASLKLSSGELLFGGIKGFNIFHPDSVQMHHAFPNLVISGIQLFNKPVTPADNIIKAGQSLYDVSNITLPYDKAFISFSFSALEFTAPEKIAYAYMLEGWDKTWNYAGDQRTASYSNLREGNYILRIKSTNAEGVWNEQERVVHIRVLPPWYRSWWAYGAYAALVAGLVYGYSRYKAKQTRLKYELDIARIKAEKETELNEKKISFFTNVSHEFRTPLTLIINPIKELADKKRDHLSYQDLAVVYRNARRLLGLVDQLLLFRKADSGEDSLKIGKLPMHTICEEVYLSFTHQAKTKNITYTFSCANKSVSIFGDREKIEILLFNLLSNAFKFTPASGTIELRLVELNKQVEITVQDSGCGIPPETGEKLFNKFQQVYGSGKAATGGFGIGLYLVKKFVESHQGEILYASEVGKGTRFTVVLPTVPDNVPAGVLDEECTRGSAFLEELVVATQPAEEPVVAEEVQQDTELDLLISEKPTMLLVEDNAEIRQYIRQIFTDSFSVLEAEHGEAGLALAQEHLPDIIISDVMMEVMDGLELCLKIKENASLNHIPIILLTASSSPEFRLKGIEGGAVDYITKPFQKDLLVARVESVLKSRDNLQQFFYNQVTLKSNRHKISAEYSDFFDACVETIERHMDDSDFNVKVFAREMGMSHSNLYKRVKDISGRSVNDFIRFIRLRKVAKVLINTDCKVNEAAFQAGFNDIKYFREQFNKLFGMNPSEYIKKYRKPFHKNYTLNEKVFKEEEIVT
ncbi:hybrid sensor histidine kinase/response regulator transcription factor [Pontibacter beigongshangensis]|uniref:hybrid sensor histidine kinase/response regulator transcription factor n=1 Tax=Pontibacter beigongshangensis TaxID=2574733 RepID=UPI00164F6624|nr:two-component regulator propeller domain-containing protein [Pontibacter beigongshangensis]